LEGSAWCARTENNRGIEEKDGGCAGVGIHAAAVVVCELHLAGYHVQVQGLNLQESKLIE